MPIVGGAAEAAGIGFGELLSLMGKLSDAGIDASMSANALKNIFIESAHNPIQPQTPYIDYLTFVKSELSTNMRDHQTIFLMCKT